MQPAPTPQLLRACIHPPPNEPEPAKLAAGLQAQLVQTEKNSKDKPAGACASGDGRRHQGYR
jgi:hypothetical protein